MKLLAKYTPLAICFAIVFLLYLPGLSGQFLLDDYTNLVRLEFLDGSLNGYLMAIFNNTGEVLTRPISFASFLINRDDWPDNPYAFKLVNVLLHLLTGLLLLAFLKKLPVPIGVNSKVFIFVTLSLWILSPLNVSTTLYVVQRMTILSLIFGLLSAYSYLAYRLKEGNNLKFAVFTILFLGCSFLSKENGLAFILTITVLEFYLRFTNSVESKPVWLLRFLTVGTALFFLIFLYKAISMVDSFERRGFSLLERILVEGRVLIDYMWLSVVPDVRYMSLFHDAYEWNTKSTLVVGGFCWVLHAVLLVFAWRKRKIYPLVFLGVAWFYSLHIIESTILPLELMFEHRNYAPGIGLFIALGYLFARCYEKIKLDTESVKKIVISLPIAIFAILLLYRTAIWGDSYSMLSKWAYYKPDSKRAQYSFMVELERVGLLGAAHEKSMKMFDKFGSLGFYLYYWRTGCFINGVEEAFISPEKIQEMVFSSEIGHELGVLTRLWSDDRCMPEGYEPSDVEAFFTSILQMKMLDRTPKYKAKLIETIGKYYEDIRLYNKAVEYKLALYEIQPSVDTALRNAEFALKFNLLEYAEEFISKAWTANEELPFLAADRSEVIAKLEEELNRRLSMEQESKGKD